ncbi:SPOR domain-containing protein [Glaciimonas sp. PCH181]|uniref:SPOR domain-containing protein n=1 Tax=Glaciimonas sp. PCH181 TaxID=2133943 RepID=UPI000D3702CB|nr:SPOR domain-containing protein [Glaciimonas sp. PCH181]PUA18042.1 SPOR domain-containing protein [Glaciimonas sp. PCH181]
MLKFIFWLLVLGNVGLFALQRGYLDDAGIVSSGREPARLTSQLQADKIKLMAATDLAGPKNTAATSAGVSTSAPQASNAGTATPPASAISAAPAACTEIGNFNAAEARRFSSQLAELAPRLSASRREIQEVGSYRVFLPTLGSKEAANKKAAELRALGITDFFVIQEEPPLLYGISLGTFKMEEAAQLQVKLLEKKGIAGLQIAPRNATAIKVAFQLQALSVGDKAVFDKIMTSFPHQEIRSCE